MGLSFRQGQSANKQVGTASSTEELTSENIRFLEEIGLKLARNNGYTGYNTGTDVRRDHLGKGISYAQPLRFIKIKQQR